MYLIVVLQRTCFYKSVFFFGLKIIGIQEVLKKKKGGKLVMGALHAMKA